MPENRTVRELYNEYLRGNATLDDVDQVARRVIARFERDHGTASASLSRGKTSGPSEPTADSGPLSP